MSGAAHLRIVIALLVVGGISSLAPYVASPFFKDITPFSPFGWVGGLGGIALAAWLCRGSNIARNLLVIFSILGLLFYGILLLTILRDSWSIAAVLGIFVHFVRLLPVGLDVLQRRARRTRPPPQRCRYRSGKPISAESSMKSWAGNPNDKSLRDSRP